MFKDEDLIQYCVIETPHSTRTRQTYVQTQSDFLDLEDCAGSELCSGEPV